MRMHTHSNYANYTQVIPSLRNMVAAAKALRAEVIEARGGAPTAKAQAPAPAARACCC